MSRMTKKNIIEKTLQVGFFIFMSRVFGFIREMYLVRYLGVNAISDAYNTAFKIPNGLRKIFAEGALSSALIPSLVGKRNDSHEISRIITFTMVVIQAILLLLCFAIWWNADTVVTFTSPGYSVEQHSAAVPLLKVLIAFILFISSSAIIACGLQAINHFFIPAAGQIAINIVFIGVLLICLAYDLPVIYLAYGIVFAGFVQTIMHIVGYFYSGLTIALPNKKTLKEFWLILIKFFPCLITMSILEISIYIDGQFASYLQVGSTTFISYASNFMRIPLGIFAVAFSTILLPHFSRIAHKPKRLSFYLLESIKTILWVSIPAALLMGFFSYDIFYTTYYSPKFTLYDVQQVSILLQAFLCGLIFFSLNKILVNIYYAFHHTLIPTIISVISLLVNILFNYLLMHSLGALGLVIATSLSAVVQTILFLAVLYYYFDFKIYLGVIYSFMVRYIMQLAVVFSLFFVTYYAIVAGVKTFVPLYSSLLLQSFVMWLWVGPLCLSVMVALYYTRRLFKIRVHFLK
jgi:putative peptidoglycan lipid II flippase